MAAAMLPFQKYFKQKMGKNGHAKKICQPGQQFF
jgi:hypothetical protein